jgi:hypothetical protein
MKKLVAVEEAKTLFAEAQEWSVWGWLTEKKRVRRAADAANQALDDLDRELKNTWGATLMAAYDGKPSGNGKRKTAAALDPSLAAAVERCRDADDEARAVREDAENIFDEAERCLSAGMARQGARRAIESWEVKESAIRKSEALARRASTAAG